MTAIRVITDHEELEGSGRVSHEQLDLFITGSAFLVVSGSGPLPDAARRLVAGPGIVITDGGPGGNLTISAPGSGQAIQWNEVPAGANDKVNKVFTLLFSPNPASSLMLFINGVKQRQGTDSDYTLVGNVITLITDYRSGSNIDATYPY